MVCVPLSEHRTDTGDAHLAFLVVSSVATEPNQQPAYSIPAFCHSLPLMGVFVLREESEIRIFET